VSLEQQKTSRTSRPPVLLVISEGLGTSDH
jgi:hypothetical protein